MTGQHRAVLFMLVSAAAFAAMGAFVKAAAGVSIYSYTTIMFSALLGVAIWGEVPDVLSLIGGVLILTGGALAFVAERHA